jgi:hypothetical protein
VPSRIKYVLQTSKLPLHAVISCCDCTVETVAIVQLENYNFVHAPDMFAIRAAIRIKLEQCNASVSVLCTVHTDAHL